MKNLIIVLVLTLLITVGVFAFLPKDNQEVLNTENTNQLENNTLDNLNNVDKTTEINLDSNLNNNTENNQEVSLVAESKIKGSYEVYDPTKIILAKNNDVVLFFHASWCPSCRSLDKDINQNLNNIPEGVLIMKVDYDKERDLKKKYGVTYQHTLVQVDENGNMISKWSGSDDLIEILNKIK